MAQKVCSNPDCQKPYDAEGRHDDGFCCFDCWEQVNCKDPQEIIFEDITLSTYEG